VKLDGFLNKPFNLFLRFTHGNTTRQQLSLDDEIGDDYLSF